MRKKALQLYVDGMNLRRIARHLGVHHRTVSLWIQAQADQLPDPPVPSQVKEAEMDELFTFIGEKKKQIYVITIVDHFTRCYLGFQVVWQRTQEVIQEMVDEAPKPSAAPATLWMPMSACGITGASMKSPKAKRTPIRLKGITLSCAIIWRDWPVARVAFLVARKP